MKWILKIYSDQRTYVNQEAVLVVTNLRTKEAKVLSGTSQQLSVEYFSG